MAETVKNKVATNSNWINLFLKNAFNLVFPNKIPDFVTIKVRFVDSNIFQDNSRYLKIP